MYFKEYFEMWKSAILFYSYEIKRNSECQKSLKFQYSTNSMGISLPGLPFPQVLFNGKVMKIKI